MATAANTLSVHKVAILLSFRREIKKLGILYLNNIQRDDIYIVRFRFLDKKQSGTQTERLRYG
jgi:hypothetical protein